MDSEAKITYVFYKCSNCDNETQDEVDIVYVNDRFWCKCQRCGFVENENESFGVTVVKEMRK